MSSAKNKKVVSDMARVVAVLRWHQFATLKLKSGVNGRVARALGVHNSTITTRKQRGSELSFREIILIAEAFKVEPGRLARLAAGLMDTDTWAREEGILPAKE